MRVRRAQDVLAHGRAREVGVALDGRRCRRTRRSRCRSRLRWSCASSCLAGGRGRPVYQRRGYISRDCAVRQARQWPQLTMFSGVVDAPHSGQSTVSCEWARASLISFDRSSWMVRSPRQGQPRCASAQRPGRVATGCLLGKSMYVSTLLGCASPAGPSADASEAVDRPTCRPVEMAIRVAPGPCTGSLTCGFGRRRGEPSRRTAGALRHGREPPRPRYRQPAARPPPGRVTRATPRGVSRMQGGERGDGVHEAAVVLLDVGFGRPDRGCAKKSCAVVSIRAKVVRRVSRAGSAPVGGPAPAPDTTRQEIQRCASW